MLSQVQVSRHTTSVIALVCLCLLLADSVQAQSSNPYSAYESTEKRVSELEWSLVQINLELATEGVVVRYDSSTRIFKVKKFVNAAKLLRTQAADVRDELIAQVNLIKATIASEIPEFTKREKSDLKVEYFIGEPSARCFASYTNGSFSLLEAYKTFIEDHRPRK